MNEDHYINIKTHGGITCKSVKKWFKLGLRRSKVSGTVRVKAEWVDEFLEQHEVENLIDSEVAVGLKKLGR